MLTPEVEKYLDEQFEKELDAREIVKDLIAGGWRDADAKTVVRQYETKHTLAAAPPPPPKSTPPAPSSGQIDFSKVDSHGAQVDGVEIGRDFIPEKRVDVDEDEGEDLSGEIQKTEEEILEEKRKAREESLVSARVNANASYDDFVPTFGNSTLPGHGDLHRNRKADPYKTPKVTFNPLDIKPKKEAPVQKQREQSAPPAQQKSVSKKSGRGKMLFLLGFVWLVIIAVIVGLYFLFVHQTQPATKVVEIAEEPVETTPPSTVLSVRTTPESPQEEQPQIVIEGEATCGDDMDCFVFNARSCKEIVSVEKTKETTFFASKKDIRSYLEIGPDPGGNCLFKSKILSINTEFTAPIAQETMTSVRLGDQRATGLTGQCYISPIVIPDFLDKLRSNRLTDFDYLSFGCIGKLYEQTEISI